MLYRTLATISAVALATHAQAATFCERLAPEIGLSPKKDRTGTYWQKNALNPAQRLLFGGTAVMSLGAESLGAVDDAERRRVEAMCVVEKKGIVCNVAGPARISAALGGAVAKVEAQPGERAKLWTAGSRVRCQDLPAG